MSDNFFSSFAQQVGFEIIVGIIVTVIIGVLGLLFKARIWKFVMKRYFLLTDKQAGIISIHTRKYNEAPTKEFNNEVFNEIKREITSDEIEKRTVNPKFMFIYSHKLGMQIDIQLEEEPDLETLSSEMPKISSYNVIVKMDAEIKGVGHIDRMEHFVNLAERIQNTIQVRCFPNAKVLNSFLVCDILQHPVKHEQESMEDTDLKAKVTYTDNYMTITTTAPQNLAKTVKKYVYA